MNVCVIGMGYIGFPTACLIAQAGYDVVGVDIRLSIVDQLKNGIVHIENEKGLVELAQSVLQDGRLQVSASPQPADVFIIAVPTPFEAEKEVAITPNSYGVYDRGYRADLSYVEAACRGIAPLLQAGNLVILESTVPPGTTEKVKALLEAEGVATDPLFFAHAPERVLPGNIIHELIHNDRIMGGLSPEAGAKAAAFYRTFIQGEVIETDATTAELSKLMENTFRDVNIALANEFSQVCEHLGVDVWEAIRLCNHHPRVNILRPGPGVGGHCIAVDPYFIVETSPEITPLIQTARKINRRMPEHVVERFLDVTRDREIEKVVILGAAYKANVSDDRESPSLEVAHLLEQAGFRVVLHDPHVERFRAPLERVLLNADAILLLTDHDEYRQLDPHRILQPMRQPFVLDTRACLDLTAWQAAGFQTMRLGTGTREKVVLPS